LGFGSLHPHRVEGGDVGGQFGGRQSEIAGDAHEGADANDLAVADAAGLSVTDDAPLRVRLARRRQAVGFASGRRPVARAAQRELHALGNGGEIALPVQRRENGAAHESRAAQTGQNCAAEPLHRYAPAIDEVAGFPVNGQRRLMAEVDMIGLAVRPVCTAPFAVIQDPTPPLATSGWLATTQTWSVRKRGRQLAICPEARARCRGSSGPSMDRALAVLAISGCTSRSLRARPPVPNPPT